MARRYDVRLTRDPWDRFWSFVLLLVIFALLARVSYWLAVALGTLLLAWWIVMRFLHAARAHRR